MFDPNAGLSWYRRPLGPRCAACVATPRVGLCGRPVWTSRLIGPRLAAALGSLTHALGRKEAAAGPQPSQLVFGTGSLADYTLFMHGAL